MVIKMYISGISASKEVKKRQLRAEFLLDSYKIKYEKVDITDATEDAQAQRDKMIAEAKRRNEAVPPLPPQFFNEDDYCGDFEDLESANDNDDLFKFLKLEEDVTIENGGDDMLGGGHRKGEYDPNDLFVPPDQRTANEKDAAAAAAAGAGAVVADKKQEENKDPGNEDEDEELKTEVVEQVTINGVVYTIPADRKLNIGGRVIDVDELLATEGEEVDLEEVSDDIKNRIGVKSDESEDTKQTEETKEEEDEQDDEREEDEEKD